MGNKGGAMGDAVTHARNSISKGVDGAGNIIFSDTKWNQNLVDYRL